MQDLMGKKVFHKTFGEGYVCELYGKYISIVFQEEGKTRRFAYPDVFEKFMILIPGPMDSMKKDWFDNEKPEAISSLLQVLRHREQVIRIGMYAVEKSL